MTAFTDQEFVSGTTITSAWLNGVNDKLKEIVSVKDFGAIGDGTSDDTTALINFFNSAIANPGVVHRLDAKTYAVSSILPTINVSNVQIVGEGADIHDVGSIITGTVIKWIGTNGTAGPLVTISSVSGGANQRVHSVVFSGIGINCNNGTINTGLRLVSIRDCDIDVAIVNAGFTGLDMQVVASLGEAKDIQRCKIHLKARQIESPAAFALVCNGDATANVSMNEFWCDIQHKNLQAIYLQNSDNNDWRFVRTYVVGGGTATESIACLGGASAAVACRAEKFWFLTCNLPVHVYGTSGSPSFASPSINHSIFNLDTENGSPVPVVEAGGSIHVQRGSDQLAGDPWVPYTPTLSATSGSLTTAAATGWYLRRGKIIYFKVQISITTNGTAAGALGFTVPVAAVGTNGQNAYGKERSVNGKAVTGFLDSGASVCYIQNYDGTYPGVNGAVINVSGFYEVG